MQLQQQKVQVQNEPQQVLQDIKIMNHFSYQIPLPQTATLFTYGAKHQSESKKKKKIKNKFDSFTYYELNTTKTIAKILFLNDDTFIDQGEYPFTDPSGKERPFTELSGKRLKITEAAYIGHVNDQLIIKKMQGVKLGDNGLQVETVDDKFQVIRLDNPQRFGQFMKVMGLNKNAINLSIRVIIDETDIKEPKVIDFELFFREKQLMEKHKLVQK